MSQITRYIFLQSLLLTLLVTLGLTAAFWLAGSLRLIEAIVDRGDGLWAFIDLALLNLPQFLIVTLPVGCFVGVQFAYRKLIADSELVVMRACGASQIDLAKPALYLGLLAVAAMYTLTLYFLPVSKGDFKSMQFQMRNHLSGDMLQEGAFTPISHTLTVYVKSRDAADQLRGIVIQDERDPQRRVTLIAERGLILDTDGSPRVVMLNGSRQTWDSVQHKLYVLSFDRWSIDISQFGDAETSRSRQPDELFLSELFATPDPKTSDVDRLRLWVEGNNRLTMPLYCLTFIMITLGFLLSGEFSRRGQTARLTAAWLIVAGLEACSIAAASLSGRHAGAIVFMYAVPLIPFVVSALALFRPDLFSRSANDMGNIAPAAQS